MKKFDQGMKAAEKFGDLPVRLFHGGILTKVNTSKGIRDFAERLDIPLGLIVGYRRPLAMIESPEFWKGFKWQVHHVIPSKSRPYARGQRKPRTGSEGKCTQ